MRRAVLAVLVLSSSAVFFALGLRQVRATAPCYDEPVHLASGYVALTRGQLINGADHPPLAEAWAALPLLAMRVSSLPGSAQWGRLYNYADAFLYKNSVDAERMMTAARLWSLAAWGTALCAVCVLWAASLGGAGAGAFAGFFCAAWPLTWSNAAVVGTDAASAAFFAGAFFFLSRRPRGRRHWLAAGACAGLALASKFNMAALPLFAAAALLTEARLEPARRARPVDLLCAAGAAAAAVALVYGGDLEQYWSGLTATLSRLGEGRPGFLAGRRSTQGWWWYFPAALALKTPLPLAAAALAGAGPALRRRGADEAWLVLPPALYFLAACASKTQIGVRHVLPVAPFVCVLAGLAAARWAAAGGAWRAAAGLLAALQLAATARAGPDGLTYFNELAGRGGGYRWLVDSNLDWGQGLKALAAELAARGHPPVYLAYFGVADPSYYGIRHCPVGWSSNVERREGVSCPGKGDRVLFALSATNLQAVYFVDGALYSWLDPESAVARPDGSSIFLFDLTDDPVRRQKLVALLKLAGAIIP